MTTTPNRFTLRRLLMGVVPLLCAVVLLLGSRAWADGAKQDYTLHNETGMDIHKVFTSAHDKNTWEEDVLGEDILKAGESLEIKFDPKEEADVWDLKVETEDGKEYEWYDLDLSKITDITLHWDKDAGKGTDEEKKKD